MRSRGSAAYEAAQAAARGASTPTVATTTTTAARPRLRHHPTQQRHGSGLDKYRGYIERTIAWFHVTAHDPQRDRPPDVCKKTRLRTERRADIHHALGHPCRLSDLPPSMHTQLIAYLAGTAKR